MKKQYYYALFDEQLERIMAIVYNETSRKEVRKQLINFMLHGNFSKQGETSIRRNILGELLDYYDFKLLKSDVPFSDYQDIIQYSQMCSENTD